MSPVQPLTDALLCVPDGIIVGYRANGDVITGLELKRLVLAVLTECDQLLHALATPAPSLPATPPVSVLGIPVRLDATLTAPGEVWLEGPDGSATRVE